MKLQFGNLTLVHDSRFIFGPKGSQELSEKEYEILWLLVQAQGEIVSKEDVVSHLYEDSPPSSNTIESFLVKIRKKMKSIRTSVQLVTVSENGYMLLWDG